MDESSRIEYKKNIVNGISRQKDKIRMCKDSIELIELLRGVRFCVYYYDKEGGAGFYSNKGGELDPSYGKVIRPRRRNGYKEFNCYDAYEIAKSPTLPFEEKQKRLDEMCDAFTLSP